MVKSARVVVLEDPLEAWVGLAVEEVMLRRAVEGEADATILVWRSQPAVVVGVDPRTMSEVDLDSASELGLPVVRRKSGGGAVYLDPGCLVYSVVIRDPPLHRRAEARFRIMSRGVFGLLEGLGLRASFRDLAVWVGRWKVSGNAERILYGALLHHGTLLVDSDLMTLYKVISRPKAKVANLISLCKRRLDPRDLMWRLASEVASALDLEGAPGGLTDSEWESAAELAEAFLPSPESAGGPPTPAGLPGAYDPRDGLVTPMREPRRDAGFMARERGVEGGRWRTSET